MNEYINGQVNKVFLFFENSIHLYSIYWSYVSTSTSLQLLFPVSLSALKPLFNPSICLQLIWSILTWVCDHSLGYEQPRSSHVFEREPASLSQQSASANSASDKCEALRVLVYPCWDFTGLTSCRSCAGKQSCWELNEYNRHAMSRGQHFILLLLIH